MKKILICLMLFAPYLSAMEVIAEKGANVQVVGNGETGIMNIPGGNQPPKMLACMTVEKALIQATDDQLLDELFNRLTVVKK